MTIVSINEERSQKGELAIQTEPPMTSAIYEKLVPVWKESSLLQSHPVRLEESLLVSRISNVTPEIAKAVQQLLDEAEQEVFRAEDAAREQAEAEQKEKRKHLEAAAKAFGVPIR